MLGAIGFRSKWYWGACGKHPLVKDYLTLGKNKALVKSFASWIENGYQNITSRKDVRIVPCSWRFWAKGAKGGALVCGLLKASSDRIGRHYPFLVIGNGVLDGWEKRWDLLPFACERMWSQMEKIAAGSPRDVRQLEEDLERIKPPVAEWEEFGREREEWRQSLRSVGERQVLTYLNDLVAQALNSRPGTEAFLQVPQLPLQDPWMLIAQLHTFFMSRMGEIPNAVFMGGTVEKTFMSVLKRRIVSEDLIQFWSLTPSDSGPEG